MGVPRGSGRSGCIPYEDHRRSQRRYARACGKPDRPNLDARPPTWRSLPGRSRMAHRNVNVRSAVNCMLDAVIRPIRTHGVADRCRADGAGPKRLRECGQRKKEVKLPCVTHNGMSTVASFRTWRGWTVSCCAGLDLKLDVYNRSSGCCSGLSTADRSPRGAERRTLNLWS